MEHTEDLEVVVIGGGPGGVEAAAEAGARGMRTAIISEMPLGGRATYGSLLPSKAWLHAAEHGIDGQHSASSNARPDPAPLRARIGQLQRERTDQLAGRLAGLGVEVVRGTGRLLDSSHVKVYTEEGERTLTAANIVVAAGSEPRFFPNVKPDGNRIIAPRHTQKLEEVPQTMVMVGGGVTGTEYTSAFQKMGTQVHLITDIDRLLPRTDPEVAARLRDYLESIGVELTFGSPIKSVASDGSTVRTTTESGEVYTTDYAFIATGRRPDWSFAQEASEKPAEGPGGWVEVDAEGRTSVSGVYATGDIAGAPLTANNAHYMARRIVSAIAGEADGSNMPSLLEAVYTDPQVVHVGPVSELANGSSNGAREIRRAYNETLLGRIHGADSALLKVWVDEDSGLIRGAVAFGENAVEVLAPVQLAMEHGIGWERLRSTPFAHPALSEVLSL
jgi:dihydrolipoamide dehydrogenase